MIRPIVREKPCWLVLSPSLWRSLNFFLLKHLFISRYISLCYEKFLYERRFVCSFKSRRIQLLLSIVLWWRLLWIRWVITLNLDCTIISKLHAVAHSACSLFLFMAKIYFSQWHRRLKIFSFPNRGICILYFIYSIL